MKSKDKKIKVTSSQIEIPAFFKSLPEGFVSERPGEFPYTRGIHNEMYRSKPWTMRQYAGFSSASESNLRYKELLAKGAKGLSVAFDLPTQMGYDADHSLAQGEVGRVGVPINTIEDMRVLFSGINLGDVSTSMTINATAGILLCMYECVAEEQGVSPKVLSGTIQNDLLKEYLARGTYIYPPPASLKIITDIFQYCAQALPLWNTISISGYHIREAGCTAVQEIAFTLANAITYVEAALAAGLSVDEFAPRLSFFFNVHNNFIEEIAKFRAARKMWSHIMRDRFHAKDERSMKLRFHSQVAGSTLTAQQPLNNIARVTLQALASVLGGTQSLHTNAYDEALQLPSSESAEIALRTQQIIACESGVTDFVDVFAGSYAVENLTASLEKKAYAYIDEIEKRGGVLSCIENGYMVGEISKSAYQAQLLIENKMQLIVGVNAYQTEAKTNIVFNKIPAGVESQQLKQLSQFKSSRDGASVKKQLASVKEAAAAGKNIMPAVKNAVKANCTLGEISDVLRDVYGVYTPKYSL